MNNEKECLVKILEPLCKKGTLKIKEKTWELILKKQFEQKAYYMFIESQARKFFPWSELFTNENNEIIIDLYFNV